MARGFRIQRQALEKSKSMLTQSAFWILAKARRKGDSRSKHGSGTLRVGFLGFEHYQNGSRDLHLLFWEEPLDVRVFLFGFPARAKGMVAPAPKQSAPGICGLQLSQATP